MSTIVDTFDLVLIGAGEAGQRRPHTRPAGKLARRVCLARQPSSALTESPSTTYEDLKQAADENNNSSRTEPVFRVGRAREQGELLHWRARQGSSADAISTRIPFAGAEKTVEATA